MHAIRDLERPAVERATSVNASKANDLSLTEKRSNDH
jgi:hypothetical protein